MLDNVLTTLLIVVVPAFMMWRSLKARGRPPGPRLRRYTQSIAIALGLIAWLAVDWAGASRPLAALGLDFPLSVTGLIGLGLAVCILAGLSLTLPSQMRKSKAGVREAEEILPETKLELIVFLSFCIIVGTSWEVLYRGYLLWELTPKVGLIAAVAIAATTYGAAHGYRNFRLFAGSLISAFLFVIAYVLTKSLWWLILLHCTLPMLSAVASYASRRAGPLAMSRPTSLHGEPGG